MSDDLIKFGKYKGKPIEVLANDPEYCEWLLTQPWLKQEFKTIIINNFKEPECTPEHNAMQIKFFGR